MNRLSTLCLCLLCCLAWGNLRAAGPQFSTAGFYVLPGTGRTAYNMNPGWRLHKGAAPGAQQPDFDDSGWQRTALPDGIELLPTEASGGLNYQGEVWYRKRFVPEPEWEGKKVFAHFEAIMGRSEVWLNGHRVAAHRGGYLPVIADLTPYLEPGRENVIAVRADNSDDPSYPPGKPQRDLDFTYCGGIYRDCWLVVHGDVYLTDPNYESVPAGGGLFVAFDDVSERSARILLSAHVRNASARPFAGRVTYELCDASGRPVLKGGSRLSVGKGQARTVKEELTLKSPQLWEPDRPYLYRLHVRVMDGDGHTVDGYTQRVGIRSFEFRGEEGFWLNGKPFGEPLIGANRHQDFAVVGNALSNSLHWRDAKKLRDAGLRVIRNAHYPQDPAFMDACDELGLLVIVNTPGWQFWNNATEFTDQVYDDIRNMVRRDRNRPSVWLWEPILNETGYPDDFARRAVELVREEYPYPSCYMACDATARGNEYFPVLFAHPTLGGDGFSEIPPMRKGIAYFTREWGDNVDDWSSHNSPSRASRAWGEVPMLVQAKSYGKPDYRYTCYDVLWRMPAQHVGGCLWHAFDHQRGYHPDPFYGGLMDAFRQPKLSYELFRAQRPPRVNDALPAETGPMVFIAHAMTPFSPADVTVFSNCEEVRLTCGKDGPVRVCRQSADSAGMPSPAFVFPDVFNVMDDKRLSRSRRQADSYLLAEGLIGGKVVATHKVMPARRPVKLLLWADDEGTPLQADGSDLVTIVAAVADANGTIKRLNNSTVRFEVSGEGVLVADAETFTNPRAVQWGTAPVLLRATTRPGRITVRASIVGDGPQCPQPAELELQSLSPAQPLVEGR